MSLFKKLFEDITNEYIYEWQGKKIIITSHAVMREYRQLELTQEEKESYFRKCIKKLSVKGGGEYLIYSKSINYGMIFEYRKDFKNKDDKKLHLIIETCLPKFAQYAKKGTVKLYVESFRSDANPEGIFSDQFCKWITSVLKVPLTEGKGIDVKGFDMFGRHWTMVYIDNKLNNVSSHNKHNEMEILEII